MTDQDRRLEVGKTYRAVNGATITVTATSSTGSLEARVDGDFDSPEVEDGHHPRLYFATNGECYAIPRLNVDWDHPDNQRSKAVKYDIKSMKLVFDVKGKPALAKAIAARLQELGGKTCNEVGEYCANVSFNWEGRGGDQLIHFGGMEANDSMWTNYRLTTLDDLYNLEAWAKPEKPELPDKPSELLFLAVDDLEKTEAMPDKYKVDMCEWHTSGIDVCYVCFAGGVMAQTLQVPMQASKRPFSFDDQSTREKLLALDDFRRGKLAQALKRLDIDLGVEPPPVFPVEYRDDPDTFKYQMRSIANWLRRIGH